MFEKLDAAIAKIRAEYEDNEARKKFKVGDGFKRVRSLIAALESRIAALHDFET